MAQSPSEHRAAVLLLLTGMEFGGAETRVTRNGGLVRAKVLGT